MVSGGDGTEAVADVTADLAVSLTLNDAPARPLELTATWLDILPLEILEKVASWLDWPSRLRMRGVSAHCRDAVELLLGRLRAVTVVSERNATACLYDTDDTVLWEYDEDDVSMIGTAQLTELMFQLASLEELHIRNLSSRWLKALSTASAFWTRLERLELDEWSHHSSRSDGDAPCSSDLALLSELCANCPLLTDVTLRLYGGGDETVKTVVAARPCLRALHAYHYQNYEGSFLSELPAGLRELSINCSMLRSEAIAELARFSELRSLRLEQARHLDAKHLKVVLAGCVRLERLAVGYLNILDPSVVDSLPPTGLPALRHLELHYCRLTDTDMGHLLERLPDLESVCLMYCRHLTQDGVACLGGLRALRSAELFDDGCFCSISDETLNKLSSAPLVELCLTDYREPFRVTPEGLLQLTRACPTLRMVTLRSCTSSPVLQIECGPGLDEGDLLQRFKNSLDELLIDKFGVRDSDSND